MKKIATFMLILSLSLFSIGCKKGEKKDGAKKDKDAAPAKTDS